MGHTAVSGGEAVLSPESHTNRINGVNGAHKYVQPERPSSGIKVIIVGAGFGGLCAAIECHRQGHSVEMYESFKELKVLGDIISFGKNAGRIFRRWYGVDGVCMTDRLRPICIDLTEYGFNIHKV